MRKHKKLAQVFTSVFLAVLLISAQVSAYALEVPVSQTEHEIDGKQILERVYEVSPEVDPTSLIASDFEQNGFIYHMTSIVKDTITVEDEIEVTQEYEVTVSVSDENSAKAKAIDSMPSFLDYNQDGYRGKLYPVPSTLTGEITGRTSKTKQDTITKSYTFDYNDDSLVPTTNNGYSLNSITWSDGGYVDDTSIPSSYVATATYSKSVRSSSVNGWIFKMTYTGNVEYESEDTIRYTVTYTGTVPEPPEPDPIPEPEPEPTFWEKLFGKKETKTTDVTDPANPNVSAPAKKSSSGVSPIKIILGGICLMTAIASIVFLIYILVRLFKDNRVAIYGMDEMSGEYRPLKYVWFKMGKSEIIIDPLEFPAIQHYRIVLKSGLANRIKGRVITIKAGQQLFKQSVVGTAGTDYVIEVNLDPLNIF